MPAPGTFQTIQFFLNTDVRESAKNALRGGVFFEKVLTAPNFECLFTCKKISKFISTPSPFFGSPSHFLDLPSSTSQQKKSELVYNPPPKKPTYIYIYIRGNQKICSTVLVFYQVFFTLFCPNNELYSIRAHKNEN